MDNPTRSPSLEDRLISLYEKVIEESTFESYETFADEIDSLFVQLQQCVNKRYDYGKLIRIKKMHDQVISMIQSEQEGLGKEIADFKRKQSVSNQYGKVSAYEKMDAFFVDYKK